ncbi:putative reverse transcriptase domain-containing protein [Tanacetum coccineum]|uniref:Reverse transcriptase domain-containing protein n=1 Tax=Tanacetum coccineum TaxID=301880 RepID=A0ABQ5H7D5_9ASTR
MLERRGYDRLSCFRESLELVRGRQVSHYECLHDCWIKVPVSSDLAHPIAMISGSHYELQAYKTHTQMQDFRDPLLLAAAARAAAAARSLPYGNRTIILTLELEEQYALRCSISATVLWRTKLSLLLALSLKCFDMVNSHKKHCYSRFAYAIVWKQLKEDEDSQVSSHASCPRGSSGPNGNNNNRGNSGITQNAGTCYECGVQGHFKRDCPKLKNKNHGNQGGNGNALAKVYVLRERKAGYSEEWHLGLCMALRVPSDAIRFDKCTYLQIIEEYTTHDLRDSGAGGVCSEDLEALPKDNTVGEWSPMPIDGTLCLTRQELVAVR